MFENLSGVYSNLRGKIAVICDDRNLIAALYIIKQLGDSEIDIYVNMGSRSCIIKDLKDKNTLEGSFKAESLDYSVSEVFNPFEYNSVIAEGYSESTESLKSLCKTYATPFFSEAESQLKTA